MFNRYFRNGGVFIALVCAAAFAQMKIGVINSEEIFMKYKGTQDAKTEFDKIAAKIQQEATNMQKEIEDMKGQLEKQSLLLSKERKKELEDKIAKKSADLEKYLADYYGKDGKLVSKNAEMTKPIIEKINKILEKIGKEEEFDLIMDARMGGVVYAKEKYDLTDRVLKILNKE